MRILTYGAAIALAGAIGFSAALADSAQHGNHGGGGGSARVTMRACNHTSHVIMVASSFIPVGGSNWRNKGWTSVGANACLDIFETNNTTFYARAEMKGDSDTFWGSDIKQCVEYPGPYDFYTGSDDTTCPEGEPADFTTFHSEGPVYTWNLTP